MNPLTPADSILESLRQTLMSMGCASVPCEQGTVVDVRDGIAQVHGLAGCMAGEELCLGEGLRGLALRLEQEKVVCVALDRWERLRVGDTVHGTGRLLHIPCGDALLGRVVDPLGRPLDGRGPVPAEPAWPLNHPGVGLSQIQPAYRPLVTGIKFIDVLCPLARGQNRLLLGPRRSGKTALATDALLFQRDSDVLGVYVAVGQRRQQVAAIVEQLRRHGVLERTIVVATWADDPPALQMLACRAGCALAEYFVHTQGRDVLCVHDDLNHVASATRSLFELLNSPPGRWAEQAEACVEVSCLLERAAQLAEHWVIVPEGTDPVQVRADRGVNRTADEQPLYVGPLQREHAQQNELPRFPGHQLMRVAASGGSLTSLLLVETVEDDGFPFLPPGPLQSLSSDLLILQAHPFGTGRGGTRFDLHKNASRRGPYALRVLRRLQGDVWKALLVAEDLERYAQTTELDPVSRRQLLRGLRLRELIEQQPGQPLPLVDQVISLCSALGGFLGDVPVTEVRRFEAGLLEAVHHLHPEIIPLLTETQHPYSDPWQEAVMKAIQSFKRSWRPSGPSV